MSDRAYAALDRAVNAFQYEEARHMLEAVPGASIIALTGGPNRPIMRRARGMASDLDSSPGQPSDSV
jgi:hypothetical protein